MKRFLYVFLLLSLLLSASAAPVSAGASPTQKDLCKNGGWEGPLWNADTGEPVEFKNQGQCIAAVNHGLVLTNVDPTPVQIELTVLAERCIPPGGEFGRPTWQVDFTVTGPEYPINGEYQYLDYPQLSAGPWQIVAEGDVATFSSNLYGEFRKSFQHVWLGEVGGYSNELPLATFYNDTCPPPPPPPECDPEEEECDPEE